MDISLRSVTDINKRISEVIASGAPDGIGLESDAVIAECARRYVRAQVGLRYRADARALEYMEKLEGAKSAAKAELRKKVSRIASDLAATLHREWSAALLAGEFALQDGTRVSWSDATVEQHEERALMLESLAAGDLATAAIHRRAVDDLVAAGVATLGSLT